MLTLVIYIYVNTFFCTFGQHWNFIIQRTLYYTNTHRLKCTLAPCLFHTYSLLSKAGTREFTNSFLSECTVVRFSHFLMIPCCFLNSRIRGKMNTLGNVTFSALMLRCLLLSLQQLSQSFWVLAYGCIMTEFQNFGPLRKVEHGFHPFPLFRMTQVSKEIPIVHPNRMWRKRAQSPGKGSLIIQNIY